MCPGEMNDLSKSVLEEVRIIACVLVAIALSRGPWASESITSVLLLILAAQVPPQKSCQYKAAHVIGEVDAMACRPSEQMPSAYRLLIYRESSSFTSVVSWGSSLRIGVCTDASTSITDRYNDSGRDA